jgi:chromosome segregation protein
MAYLGLIGIGLLFGLVLSGIAVAFIIMRSGDGPLKESLFGSDSRAPAFPGANKPAELAPEADKKIKTLLEELRVTQRLVDQGRVEREQFLNAAKAGKAEIDALRERVAEREAQIENLQLQLKESAVRQDALLAELDRRTEDLSRLSLELRDARTELEVAESGTALTNTQMLDLQRERDELAGLIEEYRTGSHARRQQA